MHDSASERPGSRRAHILVVDDDPTMQVLAEEALTQAGFLVKVTGSGEEGLEAFEQSRPDLILLDVIMPGLDGFSTLERLRTHPGGEQTPIVMMTGLDDLESITRAYDAGATDFATKPVNWAILSHRVQYILRASRLTRDLVVARAAAEEGSRLKSEFLSRVGHEMRTPLNGVIGVVELMNDLHLTGEQREYVDIIRSSSGDLLQVIDDVLDFSSIDTGRLELTRRPFRFRETFHPVLVEHRDRAEEKGLELSWVISDSVVDELTGDVPRLLQITRILVDNAIKFTASGRIKIDIRGEPDGEDRVEVTVAIEDTGIGIPRDRQEEIFEPFTQGDGSTTRTHGGNGLGLSIAMRLVHLFEGQLWLESVEGHGSTFRFKVSLVKTRPDDSRTPDAAGQGRAARTDH